MPRTLVEGKVPGGARPGWGLPFEQLPAATRRDLTPESMLEQEIQTGRQQIQSKFKLAWDEINRSSRFIGRQKALNMRRELHTRAKQEMLQFNQQAQQQLTQLQNIDRLVQVGGLTEQQGVKIKTQETLGRDVAERMYPSPEKEKSIPQQFGELDVYSHRISQELERFQEISPKKPSKALFALGPLIGVAGAYRRLKAAKKRKVHIWDPNTGDWRKTLATPEEIAEYDMWRQAEKDIATRKQELAGRPDISRRRAQPGVRGGFDAGVAGSVGPQRQPRRQSTATELRQRGTREAYEQGKKLGYWN